MTKEELIDMARKSDFEIHPDNLISWDGIECTSELIAFAKLVAEKAIKEALAQEQEPVTYSGNGTAGREADAQPTGFFFQMPKRTTCPNGMVDTCCENYDDCTLSFYDRTWVGLTRMDLIKCGVLPFGMSYELCQAIEAKLKQKNGYAEEKNT